MIQDTGEKWFFQTLKALNKNITKSPLKDDIELDIDFYIDDVSISVKTHYQSMVYDNLPFEIELYNDQGEYMEGNFARCKADYYVLLLPVIGNLNVLTIETNTLKRYIQEGIDFGTLHISQKLSPRARQTNFGRRYDNAKNVLVPKAALYQMGKLQKGYDLTDEIPDKLLFTDTTRLYNKINFQIA